MRKMMYVLCACFMMVTLSSSLAFAADYYVYCTNGKIEVDTRKPEQMKSARGDSKLVTMGKFNNKTDADKLAKKLGGVGTKCSQ